MGPGAARARRCPSIPGPLLHCARGFLVYEFSRASGVSFPFLRASRPLMACSNSALGSGLTGRLPCRMLRCVESAALLFHPSPFCARGYLRHAFAVLCHGRAERGVVMLRARWLALEGSACIKRWE